MSKQRYINTRFWDDGYIASLDPIEKLLFIYLLSNPLTEISGAYEIPLRRIAFDTGIDRDMILKILDRFAEADKILYKENWIFIVNFIKHQSKSEKIQVGIANAVNCCPDWIKHRVCIGYRELSHLILFNSIQSNSISDDEEPKEEEPLPLKTSSLNMNFKRPPRNGIAVNEAAHGELESWLGAVAVAVGAKDARSLSKFKKWEAVCMTAIQEQRDLGKFLKVIESEKERNRGKEQFFSPDTCLQTLQLNGSAAKQSKWTHEV